MHTVKLLILKDFDDGELHYEKGKTYQVSAKHYQGYIKSGVAEIYKEQKQKKTKNKKQNKQKIQIPTEEIEHDLNTEETTILEPILNNDTPKWLCRKTTITPPTNEEIHLLAKGEQLSYLNQYQYFVKDQNIWLCKKCMGTFQSDYTPDECIHCKRQTNMIQITKTINTKRWKLPRWKDIPIEEINTIDIYDELKTLLKRCIIFPEKIQYDLFALWIISSYKRECFESISFLLFLGLIESGKTRGLDLLRELGYQMIHTTGVTFPCMCRYTDKHNAGILIDEIDNKIDRKTEDGRRYLDFLKPSYRRGSVYATADKENQEETREYSNYGFKAFAGERGGNDHAFLSRCIVFRMEQSYPEIPSLLYVQKELDDIQTKLLNYRYKYNDPEPLHIDFELQGRDRELFGCIIQTAKHIGIEYRYIIDFIKQRKQELLEELQDTDEYIILKAIYNFESKETLDDAPEIITYQEIADACGWNSDDDHKKRQRIGYILHKKFHLKTKRMGNGTVLLLGDDKNKNKLYNYFRRFRISN